MTDAPDVAEPSGRADAARPTRAESTELGRAGRVRAPRSSHGSWVAPSGRADPVDVLAAQNATRLAWLVPLRHARMRVSPFAFYRGTAGIMAADLAGSPTSGLTVQLGGDAHLSNFGAYASPGRQLIVDANDFDETLRGPWEWDVKRLAASVYIAGEHLGFRGRDRRRTTLAAVAGYRAAMSTFAAEGWLQTWRRTQTVEDLRAAAGLSQTELDRRLARFVRRAKKRTAAQAIVKFTELVDGRRVIRHEPPVLIPAREQPGGYEADEIEGAARAALESYAGTLIDDRRWLLERYSLVDVGLKVVGVGSVGTRCMVLLMQGRDEDDSFLLQAKEAGRSVLEDHLGSSPYDNHGQRVVEGQRLAQAQSDIFLGWTEGRIENHHYYVRQLRDWKGSVEIDGATPNQLAFYADLCGRILARGHARTGDPAAIAAYMGYSDKFDGAVLSFSTSYAAQNRADFERFQEAIDSGRLEAAPPE